MRCRDCNEDVEELFTVKVAGKNRKLCEDCIDRMREEGAVADEALEAVRNMMGYKGKF
jgi:hypothetical protein